MKTITAAVCEDDDAMREQIRHRVQSGFQAHGADVSVMAYATPRELYAAMGHLTFTVLFLDIDLPETDGVSFAEKLRSFGSSVDIIFVSNLEDRVYDVFRVHPWGFIRKSRLDSEIDDVIASYIRSVENRISELIVHDEDGKTQIVKPEAVVYVESAGKLQMLFSESEEEPLRVRSSLRELEQSLTAYGFIRIHKGFLVNYRCIRKITSRAVMLDSGKTLPVGRDRLQQTREQYLSFMKWKGLSHE